MDELFSCRNCIQNCGQSLHVGRGSGFCLRHNSVIWTPDETTCKYLHRKDLPRFLVDEGLRQHAAEFSGMAALHTRQPLATLHYSEKFAWDQRIFDPLTHVLAQYHKTESARIFIESFAGGIDGRRLLAHACLIRRYLDQGDTWKDAYPLVLAFLQEIDGEPHFVESDLHRQVEEQESEALWDVVFTRFALLQEYGWHAGLDELRRVTDAMNGVLADFDWPALRAELVCLKTTLTDLVVAAAKAQGVFFDRPEGKRQQ